MTVSPPLRWCACSNRVGGIVLFCPNRWYPVEQHGHYWRGEYHFGNTPLINYLPDRWRNQLAPHVRTYTARGVRRLFDDQPVRIVHHTRIFGGYDNIVWRYPRLGAGCAARCTPSKTPRCVSWDCLICW